VDWTAAGGRPAKGTTMLTAEATAFIAGDKGWGFEVEDEEEVV
jgi:hypothetical protein